MGRPAHAGADARPTSRRRATFVITLLVLLSSLPFLANYLPYVVGHDHQFQLSRIESIAWGLLQGQFPVRLYPCQAYGFGYPAGVCYPDLLLYPFAILRLLGVPLQWTYAMLVVCANALTCVLAYACFRRIFSSDAVGLACAALWTLAPYRLVDMFLRASVGEYLALAFLPLIAYGIWAICLVPDGPRPLAWLALACGMAGVVLSHVLSVVLFALPGVPLVMVALVVGSRTRGVAAMLAAMGKAVLACAGLCLFFVVPFLDYYLAEPMQVTGGVNDVARHALQPLQVIGAFWPFDGVSNPWWEGAAGEMPAPLGVVLSSALVAGLYYRVVVPVASRDASSRGERTLLTSLLVVAGVLAILCTWLFPWGLAQGEGVAAAVVARLGAVQFPWRFVGALSFVAVLVAGLLLCIPYGTRRDADESRVLTAGRDVAAARTLVVVMLAVLVCEALVATTSFASHAEVYPQDAFDEIVARAAWGIGNGEYLPRQATWDRVEEGASLPEADRGVVVGSWTHDVVTSARLSVRNDGARTASVTCPLLWSGKWRVTNVVGQGAGTTADGVRLVQDEGFVAVELPPGFDGTVDIAFVEPTSWKIAGWISVLTACLCAVVVWARRRADGSST